MSFRGRVQGVGFRAACASLSGRFVVTGWVRNEPDGSVRLEAQGPGDEIDAFVHAILAELGDYVGGHDAAPATLVEDEAGFEVRR